MTRAKMPAWQLFRYKPTKDESGRWTARSRYNDDEGVRHDIKRSGRTAGAADRALRLAVKQAELESTRRKELAAQAELASFTLEELAERWLQARRPAPVKIDNIAQTGAPPTDGLRMQSWNSYRGNLRNHILPALGKTSVAGLRTPQCEDFIHSLYKKETGDGYRTAAIAKQVLTQVMDYAVRQGHRTDNPVRSVSNLPSPRKTPVKLRPATVAAVHEAVRSRQPEPGVGGPKPTGRLSDVVQFLLSTGMRIGEGLAVRWDDVQIEGDNIWVTVSGTLVEDSGVFDRQTYPKSNKSHRTLPLTNDWIQDMIRRRHKQFQIRLQEGKRRRRNSRKNYAPHVPVNGR
ncbi:site-specific integrase [Arthrobacter sp. QXT-31]|uniref:site-specific integrase n=1 Tax=Arthrobacter sp. QXT-31 TaxID=1357915 RepID=UPI000971759B|nr:tyrosine-type recombinase/integrase [Arthrobacter sp. QXT-31]APX00390.1 hypothetical protein BWQ92_00360 [Arthrobacter sp. QXT-31]